MTNLLNVNIMAEEVMRQQESEAAAKQTPTTKFDVKNYLNTRLADNEVTKTLTIRLLPFKPEGGSPFFKVHMHQVRVNKEVSRSGWKTFPCPTKNKLGSECPFCEVASGARARKGAAVTDTDKNHWAEIEYANRPSEFWIVRCIERGHEEDGVKFWLFRNSKKGDGVYDKIMNIFHQRYKKAKELGRENNIFDLNDGKDLLITISRDTNGKTVYNITDDDEKTPLSTNYAQADAWIKDTKKWNEVYTVKPFEYMDIIIDGGVPVYDKEQGKYIEKAEYEKKKDNKAKQSAEIPTEDLSVAPKTSLGEEAHAPFEEEDLPF